MTGIGCQLVALTELRSEIEGIDRTTRQPSSSAIPPVDGLVSYSFGMFSGPEQTVADILASIRTMLAKLGPVATVETVQSGLTAKTVINYAGRAATVWSNPSSTELGTR